MLLLCCQQCIEQQRIAGACQFEIAGVAFHQQGCQSQRLDGAGFIGHAVAGRAQCALQQPQTESLRCLGLPQSGAWHGSSHLRGAICASLRLLEGVGQRHRQQGAHRLGLQGRQQAIERCAPEPRARSIVHQHPGVVVFTMLGDQFERVGHRDRARCPGTVQTMQASGMAATQPGQHLFGILRHLVGERHPDMVYGRLGQKRRKAPLQHQPALQGKELLGYAGAKPAAGPAGRYQHMNRHDTSKKGQSAMIAQGRRRWLARLPAGILLTPSLSAATGGLLRGATAGLLPGAAALLASCKQTGVVATRIHAISPPPQVMPSDESSELVVATRPGTAIYHVNPDGSLSGLEVELARRFAKEQKKAVRFLVLESLSEIRWALYSRRAHFAAAGLLEDPHWTRDARFTGPYRRVTPQLVYSARHRSRPDDLDDLDGEAVAVQADSAHADMLEEKRRHGHRSLQLQRVNMHIDPVDLLAKVEAGEIAYAVADSDQVQLAQQYYPSLGVAFALGQPQHQCWAFPLGREDALFRRATSFFNRISNNGELTELTEHYFGHLGMLGYQDVEGLLQRRLSVLPRFVPLFKHAQSGTGLDWRLLAALAYQESKWNPQATSPTGVRGIMMLTADTADSLGVANRLDPAEAIPAAARYLGQLIDGLPARIQMPDRLWLALAAYNVGGGHLEDARMLAQRQGLNPSSWVDVKRMLPSLADPAVFQDLKAGYARGGEPVNFVDSVRGYYDILKRFEADYQPPFSASLGSLPLRSR